MEAGLKAEALAVEADGPVWLTILEIADRHDAATIVMGSRGLTGMRSMLLGSVSSAVVHHAARPTLVIHHRAGIDLRSAAAHQVDGEDPGANRAADVHARQDGHARDAPGEDCDERDPDERRAPWCRPHCKRGPRQVHEPVARRHERGQVLEPVGVDAPDQGADDLGARGDDDDHERLHPQQR